MNLPGPNQKIIKVSFGGFPFLLTLAFVLIVLRLTDTIDWSWLWVLSPLWVPLIPAAIMAGLMFLVIIGAFISVLVVAILSLFER